MNVSIYRSITAVQILEMSNASGRYAERVDTVRGAVFSSHKSQQKLEAEPNQSNSSNAVDRHLRT